MLINCRIGCQLVGSDNSGTVSAFTSSGVGAVGLAANGVVHIDIGVVMSFRQAAANGQNEQHVDCRCQNAPCPVRANLHIALSVLAPCVGECTHTPCRRIRGVCLTSSIRLGKIRLRAHHPVHCSRFKVPMLLRHHCTAADATM